MKKLCLSMIVKNEEKILARCLTSVLPVLACYEITDTGSTDKTKEIIRETLKDIPGHIHEVPFRDFSQARNAALEIARASAYDFFDHILLIDADMELVCPNVEAFLDEVAWIQVGHGRSMGPDALHVAQRSGTLSYDNVRVLRRRVKAHYVGKTHEYISLPSGTNLGKARHAHMNDYAQGSSRVEKFERDERLLLEELEADPKNQRAAFYLAQTYKDSGKTEKAVEWYGKRAEMGGWAEEVYLCHLYRGRMLLQMGKEAEGLAALGQAYETNPARAEAIIEIAKAHRLRGRNELACLFAEASRTAREPNGRRPPEGALFVEMPAYDYAKEEELSISGFYSKLPYRKEAGRKACIELSTTRNAHQQARELARRNSLHYARTVSDVFPGASPSIIPIHGHKTRCKPGYNALNPSLCEKDGVVYAIVRTTNFTIDEHGRYWTSDGDTTRTENLVGTIDPETGLFEGVLLLDESGVHKNENSPVRGYEDMRLFHWKDKWWSLATVRDLEGSFNCLNEIVLLELELRDVTKNSPAITRVHRLCPGTKRCEKNWVPLVRQNGKDEDLLILYSLDPTRWIRLYEEGGEIKRRQDKISYPRLALDHMRGGTKFVSDGDGGYLALFHENIDGMGRRKYMHRLVQIEDETLEVTRASEAFVFEDKTIEFAAGACLWNGKLLVTFGREDKEAKLLTFNGIPQC
jgi:tetratricopeptide (TPR) repeat protein